MLRFKKNADFLL